MLFNKYYSVKKSVAFTWLISYLLMLIIPLTAGYVIYCVSFNTIESESINSKLKFNEILNKDIDNRLRNMVTLSTIIVSDKNIYNFSLRPDKLSVQDRYDLLDISNVLKLYMSSESHIGNIYLIYQDKDLVVSYNHTFTMKEFYNELRYDKTHTFEAWNTSFSTQKYGRFVPVYVKNRYTEFARQFSYAKMIDNCIAIIVINIDNLTEDISKLSNTPTDQFYITSPGDIVITGLGDEKAAMPFQYADMPDEKGIINTRRENDAYVGVYTTSNISEWKYVHVIPESIFLEKLEHIKYITIISFVVSFILGIVLSLFLVRNNYRPLLKLLQHVSVTGQGANQGAYNEFGLLTEFLNKNINDKNLLHMKLKEKNAIAREGCLAKLFRELPATDGKLAETMENCGIVFMTDIFYVMLFRVNHYNTPSMSLTDPPQQDYYALVETVMKDIIEQYAAPHFIGYTLTIDGLLGCLLNVKDLGKADAINELKLMGNEVSDRLNQEYMVDVSISVSDRKNGTNNIHHAYREAVETMEYRILLHDAGFVVCFEEISEMLLSETTIQFHYSPSLEQSLANGIKTGDDLLCLRITDEIFALNFTEHSLNLKSFKYLIMQIISTVIKTISKMNIQNLERYIDSVDVSHLLFKCKTAEDAKEKIYDIIKTVCLFVRRSTVTSDRLFSDNVVIYVNAHFNDPNLNVSTLAAEFGITRSYFSKRFKEELGESISDYINQVRHTQSKLLLEQGLGTAETAMKTGYSDTGTFIRLFKKYEGITPGKYKEIL